MVLSDWFRQRTAVWVKSPMCLLQCVLVFVLFPCCEVFSLTREEGTLGSIAGAADRKPGVDGGVAPLGPRPQTSHAFPPPDTSLPKCPSSATTVGPLWP